MTKEEFEMTQEEMDNIIAINKNQMPVMVIGDVVTGNEVRERVNNYWMGLGDKYGFKWDTVEGSAKGKLFFLAEPKPKVILKTPEEISMEKINGRRFIEIICQKLEDEGQLLYDSNIVMKINILTDRELNQIISFGDVVDWHNDRVKTE